MAQYLLFDQHKEKYLARGGKGAHRPEFDRSRNMSFLDRSNDGPIAKLGFYTAQWIGVGRSVSRKAEPMVCKYQFPF